jgi:hypothetical protein
MRRLILVAVIASLAVMASLASVAAAATAQCYKFTRMNPANNAVISVTTQGLPFPADFTGGSTEMTQDKINIVLGSTDAELNVFFAGKSTIPGANFGKATYSYGLGTSAPALEAGYAKYSVFAVAGNCAEPPPPVVPQRNGVGMCSDKPVARVGEQPGTFLNLTAGQTVPGVTLTWAIYVKGPKGGLMCQISDYFTYGGNPASFHASGKTVDGNGNPGGNYPEWIPN